MTQFPENVETKFTDLPVEVIDWVDHHADLEQGFHTASEWARRLQETVVLRTVGLVLFEDEEAVTLCAEQRGDVDLSEPVFHQTMTIMKRLIIRRVRLEAPA